MVQTKLDNFGWINSLSVPSPYQNILSSYPNDDLEIMKGQVFTPPSIVDLMVEKLFRRRHPKRGDHLLDPGCGAGVFIEGILDWCRRNSAEVPHIVGIESDPTLIEKARKSIGNQKHIILINGNFLLEDFGTFDFIIGNPPYVRLEGLSESERKIYRKKFETAVNRFDLYILFFEKALKSLKPSGRLVFITPEKYEYTLTANPLRKLMTKHHVEEIHHVDENAFEGLVTYPTITVINREKGGSTKVLHRDGSSTTVRLPTDGSPWTSIIRARSRLPEWETTLQDICVRVSCGVATGADAVFVMRKDKVPKTLEAYAHPTVSGKDLTPKGIKASNKIIMPYDKSGLLPDDRLTEFKDWLSKYKEVLTRRSCVRKGKRRWYAFHENPPMVDILRPKILCKDIAREPKFWFDSRGDIVPQHSVYYIVPRDSKILPRLLKYLNSKPARKWITANCQRAANNFIRLQSSVLKRLPIPKYLAEVDDGI